MLEKNLSVKPFQNLATPQPLVPQMLRFERLHLQAQTYGWIQARVSPDENVEISTGSWTPVCVVNSASSGYHTATNSHCHNTSTTHATRPGAIETITTTTTTVI